MQFGILFSDFLLLFCFYCSLLPKGATKSSLLSAPSIVSMFVPAPEEFADDQPTVMTDK